MADLVSGWEDFVGFALERPQLFRLIVQRVGDNPQIVDATMVTTVERLTRLANEGRLRTDIAFARSAMLALANGVTALLAQGASKLEVEGGRAISAAGDPTSARSAPIDRHHRLPVPTEDDRVSLDLLHTSSQPKFSIVDSGDEEEAEAEALRRLL